MTEEEKRYEVISTARHYEGVPYTWGGDDPSAFDCSGLTIECFKGIGVLPRKGDWSARGLYTMWRSGMVIIPKAGDVIFWMNAAHNDIVHVEIILNDEMSIGASGGGSRVKTLQDAIKANAFIKKRPFRSRKHIKGFFNPYI